MQCEIYSAEVLGNQKRNGFQNSAVAREGRLQELFRSRCLVVLSLRCRDVGPESNVTYR